MPHGFLRSHWLPALDPCLMRLRSCAGSLAVALFVFLLRPATKPTALILRRALIFRSTTIIMPKDSAVNINILSWRREGEEKVRQDTQKVWSLAIRSLAVRPW